MIREHVQLPRIQGVIARRMLVNYRVDPGVVGALLPPPFRPQLQHGQAIAGICLIRLKEVRPAWWPRAWGLTSENAAHRIAVEWDDGGQVRQGVYIPRRDSDSRINRLLGGRLFPGIHHPARFVSQEKDGRYSVDLRSDDGATAVHVEAELCDGLPADSVFRSVQEASAFFESGAAGYSPAPSPDCYQGLELICRTWRVHPLRVQEVRSSFFEDSGRFPTGSARFDCALLMTNVEHEWRSLPTMCCRNLAPAGH